MKKLFQLIFICLSASLTGQLPTSVHLVQIADDLEQTTEITHAGDERLFVCSKDGYIKIIDENLNVLSEPFLDINDIIVHDHEQGLLSLAFHPEYKSNGWFYVFYTNLDERTQISRFSVDPDNPNKADANSEEYIFTYDEWMQYHLGGCLRFGPDGYLYISIGDAGYFDPAQEGDSYLGKILRIDVDGGLPYKIPSDNPYINDNQVFDEIYAFGLRNAWRFSFDRENGDLWISDVGDQSYEEINLVPSGSTEDLNFGWPCIEGPELKPFGFCTNADPEDYTRELIAYEHDSISYCTGSVTGGYVYRGVTERLKDIGAYIFSDFCTGKLSAIYPENGVYQMIDIYQHDTLQRVPTIGENHLGELFVANFSSGKIFHIDFSCNLPKVNIISASCPEASDACLEITIPDNENINEVQLQDSLGTVIPKTEYCNLTVGEYVLKSINDDAACSKDIPISIKSFKPYIKTTGVSCRNLEDACVVIVIRQELNSHFSYHIENEIGRIIDPVDFCRLGIGKHFLVVDNDSIGCNEYFEFEVYQNSSAIPLRVDNTTLMVMDTFVHYQWLYSDTLDYQFEPIPGANEYKYVASVNGYYRLEVTLNSGCVLRTTIRPIMLTATEAIDQNLYFKLSPNPARNEIILQLNDIRTSKLKLSIFSLDGQVLRTESLSGRSGNLEHRIDLSGFENGIYFMKVMSEEGVATTSFIKI